FTAKTLTPQENSDSGNYADGNASAWANPVVVERIFDEVRHSEQNRDDPNAVDPHFADLAFQVFTVGRWRHRSLSRRCRHPIAWRSQRWWLLRRRAGRWWRRSRSAGSRNTGRLVPRRLNSRSLFQLMDTRCQRRDLCAQSA